MYFCRLVVKVGRTNNWAYVVEVITRRPNQYARRHFVVFMPHTRT